MERILTHNSLHHMDWYISQNGWNISHNAINLSHNTITQNVVNTWNIPHQTQPPVAGETTPPPLPSCRPRQTKNTKSNNPMLSTKKGVDMSASTMVSPLLFQSVVTNGLLLEKILSFLSLKSRYRFLLVLRYIPNNLVYYLGERERNLYNKARLLMAEGNLSSASTFLSSHSLFLGKLPSSRDHWDLWLHTDDRHRVCIWPHLDEAERAQIWYTASRSRRNFLFFNLPLAEKWMTLVHVAKNLEGRDFYRNLDPTVVRALDSVHSTSQSHIDKVVWSHLEIKQKKYYLQVKPHKISSRARFLQELVRGLHGEEGLDAALKANDPNWPSLIVAMWKHLSIGDKLLVMTKCVASGWSQTFFKEIAAGVHGADALEAVLEAASLDWQDLDPYLWPALHDTKSRKALLKECWVRPEVKEFFRDLFEERYGDLAACLAVAADKPDLNPICNAIWPHLNKKGKLHLLKCNYGGNFFPKSHVLAVRSSELYKNLIKAIKSSKLLNTVILPEFPEFCEAIWPKLSSDDRKQILLAQFPGSFYRDLCERKFGEAPLQRALQSHELLLIDNWMVKVWPELSPQSRKIFLSKATSDWRKAFFFEGISDRATAALADVPYHLLSAESEAKLIGILWPFLSEDQQLWWVENGYMLEEN